ncbi:phosphate-starvation-inducible protein PsiE [Acinetobacter rathckeae]|uniref:phosphate-starvation-inducible protein PsiE n=1 Tax=Acinetobacter rathckeae TaxID=2605272 RepID=UPI0018A304F3|nr:phosphate-starvation-inducible PsiE family protein [Acinetobacter rathckeae]MBF7687770.1 phosphate-starvation-inducible PsiE family protein [Acinetobacter rathckeae]MBF7688007.1 phosphate-starvation-inducible PsiE family protein [Acinetobacter rathckeae]MBF7695939.1 phosphate-starvation-inducible PsiE family protein [Acinetobacter rathckeae]
MSTKKTGQSFEAKFDRIGNYAVEAFHYLALFIIGCMIAWSAVHTTIEIFTQKQYATIDDILLLFIYLELGAMVGIYFKTNHMPVRFLIYIAITALTRLLISVIQHDHKADVGLLVISGAILILAVAIFIVRYASWHYPSIIKEKNSTKPQRLNPEDDELA